MTDPYIFQLRAARQIFRWNGRALLAFEQGLGKTYTSLLYMCRHPEVLPAVVICPASLKWNWQLEAFRHFGLRSEVLEGRNPPALSSLTSKVPLLIINYDILPWWLEYLYNYRLNTVVLDECQYVSNRKAKRTKAAAYISKAVPNLLALSGTPLLNRPIELWPVLDMLKPAMFGSYFSYAKAFCNAKKTPWGWDFNGASNLPALNKRLVDHVMIRVLKKDVLKELPDKSRTVIPVDLSNRKEYQKALHEYRVWLRDNFSEAKALQSLKAEELTQMGYLKRLAAELKLPSVESWIEDFLRTTEEKLVVFAIHKSVLHKLSRKHANKSVLIDGTTGLKQRHEAVERFQRDRNTRLFFGNIKAAGTGLTLTAASTVLFAEIGWTPGEHAQAEDRVHRIGQKNAANIYYLVARNTIEIRLLELLGEKLEVLHAVLEGQAREMDWDLVTRLRSDILAQ